MFDGFLALCSLFRQSPLFEIRGCLLILLVVLYLISIFERIFNLWKK